MGDIPANSTFSNYTSKHAIKITSAGTYPLVNVTFDQSGTNDIETTHASGVVTLDISKGGTIPTVTETGAGTVVINNNVTISVTVVDADNSPIVGARVRITATETVGTITSGDEIFEALTDSSGTVQTTTFNYEGAFEPSGLDIAIRVRQGTTVPRYKPQDFTGIITSSGFTATTTMISDE